MKKVIYLLSISLVLLLIMSGCSSNIDNKITFQNFASNAIHISFRASLITVEAGKSVEVTEIPKGKYSYETTYELPSGTSSHEAVGEVSGTVEMTAGTKILIVYSSTFIEGKYTIGATLTSSDDLTGGTTGP